MSKKPTTTTLQTTPRLCRPRSTAADFDGLRSTLGYPPRRAIAQNRGTPLVSRSQSPSGAVDAPFWRSRSERRPPDHYTASTAADLDGLWSTLRSPRRVVDQKSTVVHPNPPQSIGVCDDEGYPQSSQSIAQMYKLTTSSTVGVRTLFLLVRAESRP